MQMIQEENIGYQGPQFFLIYFRASVSLAILRKAILEEDAKIRGNEPMGAVSQEKISQQQGWTTGFMQ